MEGIQNWRQRAARRNNQAGRWLSSPAFGRRFDCFYANDAEESGSATLDGGPARAQACKDRDSGARQQDSTDCLGRDDAEGGLRRRRITRSPSLDKRVRDALEQLSSDDEPVRPGGGETQGVTALRAR